VNGKSVVIAVAVVMIGVAGCSSHPAIKPAPGTLPPGTAELSVNGKRHSETLLPGRFAAIRREWRAGDRLELDLPLAKRLESIDTEHPNSVALISGPLVLMRIDSDSSDPVISREALLGAQRASHGAHEWQVSTPAGAMTLKPFLDIEAESYSTYQTVLPS